MMKLKQNILEKLKEQGYKMTPKRLLMIDLLLIATEPVSVLDLYEQVRLTYPDISLDTVYRTLNTLIDLEVVNNIAGLGKQGDKYELSVTHHHHLVCLRCGQTLCLHYCPISPDFKRFVQNQGYALIRHDLELYGLCNQCRQRKEVE